MSSQTLLAIYDYASMVARSKRQNKLLAEHLLLALATQDTPAKALLAQFGLNAQNLDHRVLGNGGMPVYSDEFAKIDVCVKEIAKILGEETNSVHLLLAILSVPDTYAYGKLEYLLNNQGKTLQQFFDYVVETLPQKDKLLAWICQGKPTSQQEVTVGASVKESTEDLPFGVDLTEKALLGQIDPVIGRDTETERVIQTLTRRTKNNPVLVGEPGVGKTAVVEGLALSIAKGQVPAELQGKRLVELDIASMVAGTRFRGDFEDRLTRLVNQVVTQGDVILFIDEIHNLVGAGGSAEGTMDAAEILKPALARGQLQIIGATTTREYRLYIEKDPALERRFQPITVDEPTPELAVQIVKGVKAKYEQHHNVIITDQAIETAVNLSVRYVTDRFLPDKAFDIIDEACSKLKIATFAVPKRLVELSNQLKELKRQLILVDANYDNSQYDSLKKRYDELLYEYEYAQGDYNSQLAEYKCTLNAQNVCDVVSQMTGVPVSELSVQERDKLVHLEEELGKRVIGQRQAVEVVSRAVRRQRAGLKDPNRPIGSFIFVGPTGVGKTELAKALCECLFGSYSEVIRIDMSEYMDKQSTAKLIGAPPGYVGYDEGGYLTDKVQRKPYSVVLFDEIEKAHPDVFNLLLQILDEGRLTNSHGKTIDFRNTVLILTSNIGVTDSVSTGIGFGAQDDNQTMKQNVMKALKSFFRPELLNRLDEIVLFDYLTEQEASQIAELLCFGLHKRLKGTVNVLFTQNAINLLAKLGYDKMYGARPLKRVIQRQCEDALAEQLLSGQINKGDTVVVDCVKDKITFTKNKK